VLFEKLEILEEFLADEMYVGKLVIQNLQAKIELPLGFREVSMNKLVGQLGEDGKWLGVNTGLRIDIFLLGIDQYGGS
jgi:hypothetical protein